MYVNIKMLYMWNGHLLCKNIYYINNHVIHWNSNVWCNFWLVTLWSNKTVCVRLSWIKITFWKHLKMVIIDIMAIMIMKEIPGCIIPVNSLKSRLYNLLQVLSKLQITPACDQKVWFVEPTRNIDNSFEEIFIQPFLPR